MASPLTIISNIVGAAASRGRASSDAQSSGADIFGALIGSTDQSRQSAVSRSSEGHASLNAGDAVRVSLGFGGDNAGGQPETQDAVAAAIEVALPLQQSRETIADLTDLINDLAAMRTSLANDEPVDPELLKRIDAALAQLADTLGIDLNALSDSDLAALASGILPTDSSLEARLTTALAPLAEALKLGDDADGTNQAQAAIKAIGDKLATLIAALNNGDIAADQLAQLDLAAEADPALDAALLKLANPAIKIDATAAGAVLATPQLELTEPVLTGKPNAQATAAEEATTANKDTPTPSVQLEPADKSGSRQGGGESDNREAAKPVEVKPAASTPVSPIAEDQTQAQPAVTILPTARVDAALGPRVVQAGYQTSQQQLNLPQLAFEMVRQVGEGNTRFQLRLDPAELGKIDVRIDIDKSGQVNARLTVEKAETLDLMQRDQRALERALQQAGLDGAKPNLEFSLKQNPFGSSQQGQGENGRDQIFGQDNSANSDEPAPPTINLYRGNLSASGVNIIA